MERSSDSDLNRALNSLIQTGDSDLETLPDQEIDNLIQLLSTPTQALTHEEYIDSIARRQAAVSRHLLRGGVETLRRFFQRIKEIEERKPLHLDLSMLEVSGKLLSGLYLPGANLEKFIFTESDLTGSNLTGSNLTEAVAPGAIMRGVIATGSNFTNAVLPGADLSGARLIGCTFINTVMPDVIVDRDTNFAGSRFVGTYLGNTDLSITNTAGAIFRGVRR